MKLGNSFLDCHREMSTVEPHYSHPSAQISNCLLLLCSHRAVVSYFSLLLNSIHSIALGCVISKTIFEVISNRQPGNIALIQQLLSQEIDIREEQMPCQKEDVEPCGTQLLTHTHTEQSRAHIHKSGEAHNAYRRRKRSTRTHTQCRTSGASFAFKMHNQIKPTQPTASSTRQLTRIRGAFCHTHSHTHSRSKQPFVLRDPASRLLYRLLTGA